MGANETKKTEEEAIDELVVSSDFEEEKMDALVVRISKNEQEQDKQVRTISSEEQKMDAAIMGQYSVIGPEDEEKQYKDEASNKDIENLMQEITTFQPHAAITAQDKKVSGNFLFDVINAIVNYLINLIKAIFGIKNTAGKEEDIELQNVSTKERKQDIDKPVKIMLQSPISSSQTAAHHKNMVPSSSIQSSLSLQSSTSNTQTTKITTSEKDTSSTPKR